MAASSNARPRDAKGHFISKKKLQEATDMAAAPEKAPEPIKDEAPKRTGGCPNKRAPKAKKAEEYHAPGTFHYKGARDSEKRPIMVCIDGMDGSGKSIIAENLRRVLQDVFKAQVYMLDAPNYDTPSGQVVWNVLHEGTGDIRDRGVPTLNYAVDRNDIMRKNFDSIFCSDRPTVVIANRWALTNLVYQTTVFESRVLDDNCKLNHLYNAWHNLPISSAATYQFDFYHDTEAESTSTKSIRINLPTMLVIAEMDVKDAAETLHLSPVKTQLVKDMCIKLAPFLRAYMVVEMANLIHRSEIWPWFLPDNGGMDDTYIFRPFEHINYIELIGSPTLMSENCAKRNNGGQGLDIYETVRHQQAVLENIIYLSKTEQWRFTGTRSPEVVRNFIAGMSHVTHDGIRCSFNLSQIPYQPLIASYPMQTFQFETVHVTDGEYKFDKKAMTCGWDGGSKMRAVSKICREVWTKSGLEEAFGYPIPSKFKFHL